MYVGYNIRYHNLTTIAIIGHLHDIYSDQSRFKVIDDKSEHILAHRL